MVDFCASFAASSKKRKSDFEQGKFIVFYFLDLYLSTPLPFNFPGGIFPSLGNFRKNIDSMPDKKKQLFSAPSSLIGAGMSLSDGTGITSETPMKPLIFLYNQREC